MRLPLIKLRVCGNQGGIDEDTPLDIIELYIHWIVNKLSLMINL